MQKSDVLVYFGSQTDAAKFLRISHSAISQWPTLVPEGLAARLEKKTQGRTRNRVRLRYDYRLYEDRKAKRMAGQKC
jgi:hypothetical protein